MRTRHRSGARGFLFLRQSLPACVLGIALLPPVGSQEKTSSPEDVRAAVTRHLDMTYTMPSYRNEPEWEARRQSLRKQILVAAGLWPEPVKCPLNAQIFGRLDRDEYSIEKVYFESYPGFLVTGNLFRPRGRSGPFPAVLSPHGHWPYGRLQNSELCSVPARAITLARQGYVVFTYDMVGYNDSRQVRHRLEGDREALWGLGSLGLHLWNSIRSVDFLESLGGVDKKRLACTGASGGGTQTFLLAAVDDRVSVTAPVNMISAHMQGGDVCENAPNLRVDTNNMEIAAMTAPRPMILVSATGDWTRNTPETEFPAIQRIYRLLKAEDRIEAFQVRADHNYNKQSRELVYRWFGKWILGREEAGSMTEQSYSPEFPSEMLVFYERSLPGHAKTETGIVQDFITMARETVDKLKPADNPGMSQYRDSLGTALRYSLMAEFPRPSEVEAFAVQPSQQPSHRVVRFYLSRIGKGDRVPATLWIPGGTKQVRRAILLVHPEGAAHFEKAGGPAPEIQSLLKEGCSVLIPDVFNTGRATFKRADIPRYFTTYNRTDDANRVQDILTSLSYLRDRAGTLPVRVSGFGRAGLWCLLARALAEDDAAFAVDANTFDARTDDAFLAHLNIPGIRRAGDLRTAGILNQRSPLWVHNADEGFPTSWLRSSLEALGRQDLVRIESRTAGQEEIMRWLLEGMRKP